MPTPIESGNGALHIAPQSAIGTAAGPTATGIIRPRWHDGALKGAKELDSEEAVDSNRFSDPAIFTKKVGGEVGSLTFQAQTDSAGSLFAWTMGVDVVTGSADPYTHTISSAGTVGDNLTFFQKVGSAVGPNREKYWDAKVAKLMWEAGQDQMVAHIQADIQAMWAAEIFGTDPTAAEADEDPYVWTEVDGTVTFDSTVISEVEGETLEVDTGMEPFFGDGVSPVALIEGKGNIVRTLKSIITSATLPFYKKALYNDATPSTGDLPVDEVYYAAVETQYVRSADRSISLTTPKVAIDPKDMQVAPLPEGGKIEMELGGICLPDGSDPALTITILSATATAFT